MKKKYLTKEEMSKKGLEIVAYAGEARYYYMEALTNAKLKKFIKAKDLIKKGEESLHKAHSSQTKMLQEEAKGNYGDISMIMLHAQDHLMTTILLKDLMETLIDIYKKRG